MVYSSNFVFSSCQHLLGKIRPDSPNCAVLLGQTGSGKSTVCAKLSGLTDTFPVGHNLDSMTDCLTVEECRLLQRVDAILIDTPGFLDSDRRDAQYLSAIVDFFKNLPEGKVTVIVVTIPLTETRAKSTYKDMLDTIELLMGPEVWSRTVFVMTLKNQLASPDLALARAEKWRQRLTETWKIPTVNMVVYEDGSPDSLTPVVEAFETNQAFTPQISEKINAYISANPGASIDEIVQNHSELKSIKERLEKELKEVQDQLQAQISLMEQQKCLSERLQQDVQEKKGAVDELRRQLIELQNRPLPEPRIIHTKSSCTIL